jgi:hypothetical protein
MSDKYKVVKVASKKFGIVEESTGLLLKVLKTSTLAKVLKAKLDEGTGFAGDTPPFFAQKV